MTITLIFNVDVTSLDYVSKMPESILFLFSMFLFNWKHLGSQQRCKIWFTLCDVRIVVWIRFFQMHKASLALIVIPDLWYDTSCRSDLVSFHIYYTRLKAVDERMDWRNRFAHIFSVGEETSFCRGMKKIEKNIVLGYTEQILGSDFLGICSKSRVTAETLSDMQWIASTSISSFICTNEPSYANVPFKEIMHIIKKSKCN